MISVREGDPSDVAAKKTVEKDKKENFIPFKILQIPKTIKMIEKITGRSSTGWERGKLENTEFTIQPKGVIYTDSLKRLVERVGATLRRQGKKIPPVKYLNLIRNGTSPKETERILLRGYPNSGQILPLIPREVFQISENVKKLEDKIGRRLDGLNCFKHWEKFVIEFDGITYLDSLGHIVGRISEWIQRGSYSKRIGREYLILVRDGSDPETARMEVIKKVKRVEDFLDTAENVKTLEIFLGKKIDEISSPSRDSTPFIVVFDSFSYRDKISSLFSRLGKKLGGAEYRYAVARLYLTLIREGSSVQMAKESVLRWLDEKRVYEKTPNTLRFFLGEIIQGKTLEAQHFQKLVSTFGAVHAHDILYLLRPEYRGIPGDYVKRVLAEYLGDTLIVPRPFRFDDIQSGLGYLSDKNLQEGLLTVINQDCLAFYNAQRREKRDERPPEIINAYFEHIDAAIREFSTPELEVIIQRTKTYWHSLLEIRKPEMFVDALKERRLFPDINQRINIGEIRVKKRILIADEMGLGKSASVILAKEILGVKQALILTPSNVIPTWLDYLSDSRERGGYFREGHAPQVLVVDSPTSLGEKEEGAISDYDYIICSHGRLTGRYAERFKTLRVDFLVVDEMHELKNVTEGVRSAGLMEIARDVQERDGYIMPLTGTPAPDKVQDIAIALKLLYPDKFAHVENKKLVQSIIHGDTIDLRNLLLPRMQMKLLAESIDIPSLVEREIWLDLSSEEKRAYEVLLDEDEIHASTKIEYLRKFLLNPELLGVTPLVEGCKIRAFAEHLRRIFEKKHKVAVFVNGYIEGVIRGSSAIIEKLDLPEDVIVRVIEGNTPQKERVAIQAEFNRPDKRKILLFVSGQTADVGVDFSGAEVLDFYNEPWSMYYKRQQLGRGYREGLAHPLESNTFIVRETIEEGIYRYIRLKEKAIKKLLHGVPLTELEEAIVEQDEKQQASNLEVNPELAEYYFSSLQRLSQFFAATHQIGDERMKDLAAQFGDEYAQSYVDLGARSYQANANRVSGTFVHAFVKEKKQDPERIVLADSASGPEMLKRHILERYQDCVVSVDRILQHFRAPGTRRVGGSILSLPFKSGTFDYVNFSLALDNLRFYPSHEEYERLAVFQEIHRILKKGGRAIVHLPYSLDFKNDTSFRKIMSMMRFMYVEEYSGVVIEPPYYRSVTVTLEKTGNWRGDAKNLASKLTKEERDGLKFAKSNERLRDARRIITGIELGGQRFSLFLNEHDKAVLEEEEWIIRDAEILRGRFGGSIEEVPRDELVRQGFARLFNGKRYVLFKEIGEKDGFVVIR